MHRLYTYDPGGTTGWAYFEVDEDTQTAVLVASGEFPLWSGVSSQLGVTDDPPTKIVVVYENIVPRHMDFNPVGLQVVGVIRFLCETHEIPHYHQPNAVIHGVERWGLYPLDHIKSPHAKDAIYHGIVHLRKLGFSVKI